MKRMNLEEFKVERRKKDNELGDTNREKVTLYLATYGRRKEVCKNGLCYMDRGDLKSITKFIMYKDDLDECLKMVGYKISADKFISIDKPDDKKLKQIYEYAKRQKYLLFDDCSKMVNLDE